MHISRASLQCAKALRCVNSHLRAYCDPYVRIPNTQRTVTHQHSRTLTPQTTTAADGGVRVCHVSGQFAVRAAGVHTNERAHDIPQYTHVRIPSTKHTVTHLHACTHCTALQRTEVYEYAMSLGNSQYSLPGLQPFKLVYAARLADMGFIKEAFAYVLFPI